MGDHKKPPVPPPATIVLSLDRKPSAAAQPASRAGVMVLPPVRPSGPTLQTPPTQSDNSQNAQNSAQAPAQGTSWTSTYGRPLDPLLFFAPCCFFIRERAPKKWQSLQITPAQTAITVERNARSTKQPRRSKSRQKADPDQERGRFRHTIQLEPKVERKLRVVAEILGIDLNAAIAVCVSIHHHQLTKSSSGDS